MLNVILVLKNLGAGASQCPFSVCTGTLTGSAMVKGGGGWWHKKFLVGVGGGGTQSFVPAIFPFCSPSS